MHRKQPTVPSGRIDILLGGDNFHVFPKEKDRNSFGTALLKSKISYKYLIFGRPSSKSINWQDPAGNLTINKFRANNASTYVDQDQVLPPQPTIVLWNPHWPQLSNKVRPHRLNLVKGKLTDRHINSRNAQNHFSQGF